ncbi:MAG: hypothetical protein ONB46_10635 [candidate division KSB1 bacterium]|nr:hypothetical protein [candidate division KSB1 bacterium]MDZ7366261.1 hypothetical protein [candidate division KSB1 bacterium]MDZ7404479.1 hypothetical protein [candidate division KSB1 bacterium]
MAVVRGVKEKVHLPLYDARKFDSSRPIREQITGNLIRFFVDVTSKTKLETNQQESGVLSHFNTYEARALRVVVQPLPRLVEGGFSPPADPDVARDNGNFLANFIYNSVTTFIVGEKIMIQAPTWMFPSGAGESLGERIGHGLPSPEATFRFAEPIHVDSQQNFRVEIEFPNGTSVLGDAQPLSRSDSSPGRAPTIIPTETRIWVLIDGYITRDVQ